MKESEHMSWYSSFLQRFPQLILGYLCKIAAVIFGLLFQKLLLAYFYVVAEVDDLVRMYTSLLA